VTTDNNASFLVNLIHFCDTIIRGRVKEKIEKKKSRNGERKKKKNKTAPFSCQKKKQNFVVIVSKFKSSAFVITFRESGFSGL
jgi:hypothetical protein